MLPVKKHVWTVNLYCQENYNARIPIRKYGMIESLLKSPMRIADVRNAMWRLEMHGALRALPERRRKQQVILQWEAALLGKDSGSWICKLMENPSQCKKKTFSFQD
ncbi:hypothetical protein AVEN_138162-1 [Araneus ventricosus]|uniref:Uncharacterized protein n=1 Tax=Araneus ventricosus TaxID=182803 RepID=A0A4Y2LY72_ARAVE|nr:hypothetical protein AVEN_138162-1 [Araneus ventricosus]